MIYHYYLTVKLIHCEYKFKNCIVTFKNIYRTFKNPFKVVKITSFIKSIKYIQNLDELIIIFSFMKPFQMPFM